MAGLSVVSGAVMLQGSLGSGHRDTPDHFCKQ